MKFTIANTSLQKDAPPSRALAICKSLDELPDGELLPYRELEARLKMCRATITQHKHRPVMAPYWTIGLIGGFHYCLFGNPRTIRAYNKEFKNDDNSQAT